MLTLFSILAHQVKLFLRSLKLYAYSLTYGNQYKVVQ